ncbi:MAG: pyridoxal phosphate-dependent aminotransferase [Thermoleophilia bacterium]|nr:pyridoxal phosphate-dependent aminotransferase [Thermoleophilia bacterium]
MPIFIARSLPRKRGATLEPGSYERVTRVISRAKRLAPVRPFGIDRVAAAAERPSPTRPGWPILRMENLDTDLPLPPEAVAETTAGLERPEANSWLPFTGDRDLRAAVSDFTAERTGERYDPEREIVITAGGMEGLLDSLLATVDAGDEVVVADPTYAGIVNRVHLAGATPRLVPYLVEAGEWRLDGDALSAAVGAATRAMVLMSPSMPSGATLNEDEWLLVCDLCRERDLLLIYDAAMERVLFDGRPLVHPLRFEGMRERTLVVGSLSKEHRMIGWRIGWVAGPAEVVEDVGWVHVYNTTTPVGISRRAGAAVLRGDQSHVGECVAELERRRDLILGSLPEWPFVRPGGGWSLLLDVARLGFDALEASRLLLEQASVAATAMVGWGGPVAERHVRFVYSAEPLDRLETLAERLRVTELARSLR